MLSVHLRVEGRSETSTSNRRMVFLTPRAHFHVLQAIALANKEVEKAINEKVVSLPCNMEGEIVAKSKELEDHLGEDLQSIFSLQL